VFVCPLHKRFQLAMVARVMTSGGEPEDRSAKKVRGLGHQKALFAGKVEEAYYAGGRIRYTKALFPRKTTQQRVAKSRDEKARRIVGGTLGSRVEVTQMLF
tara:strand:+ start:3565 stop:3867 length:303 start_codon:yes stop_codon:yes gene_type:complete